MFGKGMVVQFTEKHKWAGCLGIIAEAKESDEEFELITGFAKLVPRN